MRSYRPIVLVLATVALSLASAAAARAQTPAQPTSAQAAAPAPAAPAPAVGAEAPDFSAPAANAQGPLEAPVSISGLRGKVVVVAFYPKDRSSGCTAELTKFRDEYKSLFGPDVVVLPVSLDDMESHVGWAKDMSFPFSLVADDGGRIATMYGSMMQYNGHAYASRTVFVVGKDGKIAYENLKFGALDQHAYDALAAAIKQARGE